MKHVPLLCWAEIFSVGWMCCLKLPRTKHHYYCILLSSFLHQDIRDESADTVGSVTPPEFLSSARTAKSTWEER